MSVEFDIKRAAVGAGSAVFVIHLPGDVSVSFLQYLHRHWDACWGCAGVSPAPVLLALPQGATLTALGDAELAAAGLARISEPG